MVKKLPLCLDVGATNIRSALVDGKKIINKIKNQNPRKKENIIKVLMNQISQYSNYNSICISIAGYEQKGKIYGARNMDFNFVPLSSILSKKFKVPIYIENDANCACLAEKYYGLGRNKKNFVLLTLGTGIGGSAVINGKLYSGTNSAAMEIGGMYVEGNIFEKVASGNGSVNLAKRHGLNVSSFELEEMANKGISKAKSIYNEVGRLLGIGLVNISYVIDPEIIILGGGFAKVKHLYPPMIESFKKHDDIKRISPIKIVHANLSDDAGLIGASLIEKERKLN